MIALRWLKAKRGKKTSAIRRFRSDDRGVTAIEFAIIGVPFLGLLGAIFETAFVYFVTQSLSSAVEQAARTILTGQVQEDASITTSQQFRNAMICSPTSPMQRVLASFINCSNIIVDVRPASSFASADTTDDFYSNVTGEFCTGGPSDIVIVRAVYPMPVYFPILQTNGNSVSVNTSGQTQYGGAWTHMIMGISAFRNEPFTNYSGPLSGC